MRVALVVTGGVDRSGRERVIPALLWLIERLARRHEVIVYALRYHEQSCSYPLLGATVRDLGSPGGFRRQYSALVDALRGDGVFDVVHAYWAQPAGLVATVAARRLGLPCLVTFDSGELVSIPEIGYGQQRFWRHRLGVSVTLRLASRLTVCSAQMARLARAHGATPTVIPMGVDADLFPSGEPPVEGPPWRLLHVANLNPVKDQRTLLEAFRRLIPRLPGIHLDIAGEDTLRGAIQDFARRLQVDAHVTFHGVQPIEKIAALYRQAHLVVVSSRHEAAGVVALEAAAAGVPVVGTAVGYIAEWAPERAVAVPPADPAALAEAVAAVLADRLRRRRIAEAAREWTLAHDADWTAAQFERVYHDLVHARRKPDSAATPSSDLNTADDSARPQSNNVP
jgi:glycosyltransferase involved in cell wall biosynthesis